nr:uncharacterized protein LOC125180240 isoform X1 [Anser cygnoides]
MGTNPAVPRSPSLPSAPVLLRGRFFSTPLPGSQLGGAGAPVRRRGREHPAPAGSIPEPGAELLVPVSQPAESFSTAAAAAPRARGASQPAGASSPSPTPESPGDGGRALVPSPCQVAVPARRRPSWRYLPNSGIRAPALLYCTRRRARAGQRLQRASGAGEVPAGLGGGGEALAEGLSIVPRVSPGRHSPGKVRCCLWADLHASSPPPAQLRSALPRAGDGDMGGSRGRRRPLEPRLLALLLIAAGTAGTQPLPASGVRGRSVLLSPALPNGSSVKTVEWYFRAGAGKKIQVAEFGPEGFRRPDPRDRFKQRLEMPNATALRIGGLEPGDSGVYEVQIKYDSTTEVDDPSFNLSVYEPVPPPLIQHQLHSRGAQGCNVTLRCSLPPGSPARAAWQLGDASGTPWGQRVDGQTLQLAIPASALNATYTCVARSPAEEQSCSVDVKALCEHEAGRQRWYICLGVLAAVVGPLAVLLCLRRRRRRRRKAAEGAPLSPAALSVAEEPQYAQVLRRSPAEEDEQPPQPRTPLKTIYSEVGAGLAQPQA